MRSTPTFRSVSLLSVFFLFSVTAQTNPVFAQQDSSASQASTRDTAAQTQPETHPNYQDMLTWREGLMVGMETIQFFDQNGQPISAQQFDDGVVKGHQGLNIEVYGDDKKVVLRLLSDEQLAKIKKDQQVLQARQAENRQQ